MSLNTNHSFDKAFHSVKFEPRSGKNLCINPAKPFEVKKAFIIDLANNQTDFIHVRKEQHISLIRPIKLR
ncbi:hypothetical protein SDC9_176797 [bioreactor metagenome]|uniref:Uncharacterized protein n=1 Tax=bioreactor metagenome TaxID=1076179 RepID=A0A645GZ65_9ZZZZ